MYPLFLKYIFVLYSGTHLPTKINASLGLVKTPVIIMGPERLIVFINFDRQNNG